MGGYKTEKRKERDEGKGVRKGDGKGKRRGREGRRRIKGKEGEGKEGGWSIWPSPLQEFLGTPLVASLTLTTVLD
jgi:hypothetical protein